MKTASDKSRESPVPRHDAWVFARLCAGLELNGEVDRVSDAYRPFARKLAGTEADDRGSLWDTYLTTLSDEDADDLIGAVAAEEPGATPPDEDQWQPLRLGELPPVPDFPLDVLPPDVAQLVTEASRAVGCDPGMVAGPVLATAAGLAGRSASLLFGSNHFAQACLFQCNVALPGDGKSPALEYATAPSSVFEQILAEAFASQKEQYREAVRASKAKKEEPPAPPVPGRIRVDDVTLESLFLVMAGSQRGELMVRDELSALVLGLNQYKGGGGNDRPNVLKLWSSKAITIDRVRNEMREPIRIPYPMLSITGNLTPSLLGELIGRRGDDGFLDRWLFVFPDRRPKLKASQRRPVSNEAVTRWHGVAERLYARPMNTEADATGGPDHPRPHVIFPTNDGKATFDRLHDAHVDEVNGHEFPDHLRGPWSKLEEYAGRLWLVLTLLRHAADPTADDSILPLAGAREAADAWRLVGYFKGHHRRVRAYLNGKGLGGAPEGVKLVLRWIELHQDRASFSERDLALSYPPSRGFDRAMMADALSWLRQRNAVRQDAPPKRPADTPGRKPAPVWLIHPELRSAT